MKEGRTNQIIILYPFPLVPRPLSLSPSLDRAPPRPFPFPTPLSPTLSLSPLSLGESQTRWVRERGETAWVEGGRQGRDSPRQIDPERARGASDWGNMVVSLTRVPLLHLIALWALPLSRWGPGYGVGVPVPTFPTLPHTPLPYTPTPTPYLPSLAASKLMKWRRK